MTNDNRERQVVLQRGTDTIIVRGGIKVRFNASGGIDVYGAVPVTLHPAANDHGEQQAKAEPQVGERMEDGTIFAGLSPDTGTPMYTTPADAPLTMKWREALNYAAGLDAHGHKDWRLPSRAELKVLFNNRAAIGGFDTSDSFPAGYYWSSAEAENGGDFGTWYQRFCDGSQGNGFTYGGLSVRCVRR